MSLLRAARTLLRPAVRLAHSAPVSTAVRAFSTTLPMEARKKGLAQILQDELEYEKQDTDYENVLKEVAESVQSASWKLEDKAGEARFTLTKKAGSTSVRLDLDCSPMPNEEEEIEKGEEGGEGGEGGDEEGPMDGYRMLVTLHNAAKGQTVQVGVFLTDVLRIHRVTLYPAGKEPSANAVFGGIDDLPAYAGPNFDELAQELQDAWYDYLADAGVDDELAQKLGDYCAAKEQAEYVRWLSAAKNFVQ